MASRKKKPAGRRVHDSGDTTVEEIEHPSLELVGRDSEADVRSAGPPKRGKSKTRGNNEHEDEPSMPESKDSRVSEAPSRRKKRGPKRPEPEEATASDSQLLESHLTEGPSALTVLRPTEGRVIDGKIVIEKNRGMEDEYTLGHSALPL